MIRFDTPRPTSFRRFRRTAHMYSTLHGDEGTDELLAFARTIGLRAEWIQHRGQYKEHFDLFDGRIAAAARAGAEQVTPRQALRDMRRKRDRCAGCGELVSIDNPRCPGGEACATCCDFLGGDRLDRSPPTPD